MRFNRCGTPSGGTVRRSQRAAGNPAVKIARQRLKESMQRSDYNTQLKMATHNNDDPLVEVTPDVAANLSVDADVAGRFFVIWRFTEEFGRIGRPIRSLPPPCGGCPGLPGTSEQHDDVGWLLPAVSRLMKIEMRFLRLVYGHVDLTALRPFRGSSGDLWGAVPVVTIHAVRHT